MDNGQQVDVIYLDFSKAFDRINHKMLLHKLNQSGVRGDLFEVVCILYLYYKSSCGSIIVT